MGVEVFVTVGSREMDDTPGMIPAIRRYKGSHVEKIAKEAREAQQPFFILSGKHGLLAPDELVEFYDYLLTVENVDRLSRKLVSQLWENDISSVHLYCKPGPKWFPYFASMAKATSQAGVKFINHIIAPEF